MADAGVMHARSLALGLAQDLARLVVPVACAGCSRLDIRLCDECTAPWWEEPFRAQEGAARLHVLGRVPLPVWAVTDLDGSAHNTIAAWKDGGRRDLDRHFRETAVRAARAVAPHLRVAVDLAVVPVPSSPSSVRRRGVDLTAMLARCVASELGSSAGVDGALAAAGGRSRGRSSAARWEAAKVRVRRQPGAYVALLVDDVVTTGATLARASDALERAGTAVVGALVLAATPPRGESARGALR